MNEMNNEVECTICGKKMEIEDEVYDLCQKFSEDLDNLMCKGTNLLILDILNAALDHDCKHADRHHLKWSR